VAGTGALGAGFFGLTIHPDRTVWGADPGGELYTIDLDTGAFTLISTNSGDTVADITFQPGTGQMFGLGRNNEILYTIDENTGATTAVGDAGPTRAGLAFDHAGALFALSLFPSSLYTVDPGDATTTIVGPLGLDPLYEDAAFSPSGSMFATSFDGGIYEIDPATGAAAQIGNSGMANGLLGIVAIPAPPSVGALAGLVAFRRRRESQIRG